jgi:tryptophan synthase alpha chain
MNRLNKLFECVGAEDVRPLLSIYFTAGYPHLDSTLVIGEALEKAGVDFIEIGFPYSDPLADGPIIQNSSQQALENGMTLKILFDQLKDLRKRISIPVLLMGYVNPVLQYGVEAFCREAAEVGVDGVIVPDLPMDEYEDLYRDYFIQNNLSNIFLVTPQTSPERIRKIDELSDGFIYLVSSSATTGKNMEASPDSKTYFQRMKEMKLKNPTMIGFGISDKQRFNTASQFARGAIVGSAFVRLLSEPSGMERIPAFINSIRG